MKHIAICILVFAAAAVVRGEPDAPQKACVLFQEGRYLEGMNLLRAESNSPDPVRKAAALKASAEYQEQLVGNVEYAQRLYQNILTLELPVGNMLKTDADKQIERINACRMRFPAGDLLLQRLQPPDVVNPGRRKRQTVLLREVAEKRPDYYRIYEVYYHLGRHYLAAGDYGEAYRYFKQALDRKPAINFYLPLNTYMEKAHTERIRSIIRVAATGGIGILLLAAMVSVYLSRPWRWIRSRHLFVGLSMLLLWLAVSVLFYWFLSAAQTMPRDSVERISVIPPYYPGCDPSGPRGPVIRNLFLYDTAGLFGAFLFSIGISRLKKRWRRVLAGGVFSFLLFVCLTTVFYMYNCDRESLFYSPSGEGFADKLTGASYFVDYGMEPYVLTDPRAYPDLTIQNVTDVHLHQWIETYCPFSSPSREAAP